MWYETYVVAGEVVNLGLGKHGVVLELRLAERGSVSSNDDELGLARAERLESRLVSHDDCMKLESLCCELFNTVCAYPFRTS